MHITGGKFNSRKLNSPKGDNVRPTLSKTRSAIFDVLYGYIDFDGKKFLDLFAGSGIMGLEAVSRGFESAYAIEKDKKTYFTIKANYELLGLKPNVILGDSIKKIQVLSEKFDVVYIDPPYKENFYNPALEAILKNNILSENAIIVVEHPQNEEIDFSNFEILKQKKYSDKVISFLKTIY